MKEIKIKWNDIGKLADREDECLRRIPGIQWECSIISKKIENHTNSCISASVGWNMRTFAPGTLSANITSFRDLILIKYYVCSYLFQKTLRMTQSFKKNYELCRFVSDLDCYICIWGKMQFMVKILVFG